LAWAHERIELFLLAVQSEVIRALDSPRASRRRWAADKLLTDAVARNHPLASVIAVLAPAARPRRLNPSAAAEGVRHALDQQAAAERAYERERELAVDREPEAAAIVERLRPSPSPPPPAPSASLWPSGIRRPTRGRR
jgi:hypothetical protein